MRRIIQGGIIVLLGVMTAGLPITAEGVWAADNGRGNAKWETTEERVLPVRIKRDDGIEITPRDKEYVNTDMGLMFEMNDGVIEELFDHKRGKIT